MARTLFPLALPLSLGGASFGCGVLVVLLVASPFAHNGPSADPDPDSVFAAAADGEELLSKPAPGATTLTPAAARTADMARLDEEARAPATEVRIAPSATKGVIGAWLMAGPFKAAATSPLTTPPFGVDEKKLTPSLNAVVGGNRDLGTKTKGPARWTIVSSGPPPASGGAGPDPGSEGSRSVDVKASLEDATGSELIAYAAGRLHVEQAGKYLLMLGVDDGVRVIVDGNVVLSRDDGRPIRDDDDVIPLDLSAGDHEIILKLHQREGAWVFRAKLVDMSLAPPLGAWLGLPGTTAADAQALAARMSWLVVDRVFDARSSPPKYRPVLTVRYPEGAPRGVPLSVSAKFSVDGSPTGSAAFDIKAGGVAVTSAGASDLVVSLPAIEPWTGNATLDSTVAGRLVKSSFIARPQSEQALVRIERALARVKGDEGYLVPGSLDSVRFLTRRLSRFIARGDSDIEAQGEEAKEIDRLAANIERGVDPYDGFRGMMRRAVVTPLDGAPSELGLYIPPSYKPGEAKRYPLVIGLHGMNSYPLSMLRALFGLDDALKEPAWKDRHFFSYVDAKSPTPIPPVDAFVITPYAHGNTMYRELGEDDVLYMMQWAKSAFPIDETRITVTGPSMGGIGSASIPFHYPHVFAAAEPLCGYHSYVIRADIASQRKRPWERLLLEERSNVYWAENGEHLPLWIIHGTRDLPEANSGVLIERYEKLKYSIKHDHPDAGHNVWGVTYAELKGMKWLLSQRLDPHPSHVRFRTMRTRYATSAWVTIDTLANESSWGDVDARVKNRTSITMTTSGVAALTIARDEKLVEPKASITIAVDGTSLVFEEGEALVLHRNTGATPPSWEKGPIPRPPGVRPMKTGHVSGPIRDVFHEPLLFVYASDDADARANERVARGFANPPGGIPVSYPVISDAEFFAKKEALANDRALFLVGRTNKVLAALEAAAVSANAPLPIHVEAGAVTIGKERITTGRELGASFIYPNPVRPDRYIVVVAGADVTGTLRALSMPDLAPDFAVWDDGLAPSRGLLLLGSASLRAGGLFKNDWSLPAVIADPYAKGTRTATPTPPPTPAAATTSEPEIAPPSSSP